MQKQVDSAVLVNQIEAEAFRLGFCLFGVTTPEPLEHYSIYEAWLAAGLNSGMKFMETGRHRNCRRDPKLLLPEAKSILVLGWSYPLTVQTPGERAGWVAGYACAPDYHERLMEPLQGIVNFIRHELAEEVRCSIHTDSAPILERELGQRAGLGWIARNSCLISPRVGSNFLLAEILLSIDLPVSPPFTAEHCGTCHRCVDACPTQCIRSDRTIDAGQCISYQTIENKGTVPLELRDKNHAWVFGCDICQTVCPWNSRAARLEHEPAEGAKLLPAEMIRNLHLDDNAFKEKFKGSALLRPRRKGYLRNLSIALANMKETRSLPALIGLLESEPDEELGEIVRWAIEKIKE